MKAKEYLSQAYYLDQQINAKIEQVYQLRELAKRATSTFTAERISGTPQRSPMENALTKLMDMEKEIDGDIDRLVDYKRNVIEVIGLIQAPEQRLLLELRYLAFKPWEAIAEKLGYGWRNVHYLHAKALKSFEEKWRSVEMEKVAGE